MLASFMSSLLHLAGHRMAALTVLLSCLFFFSSSYFLFSYNLKPDDELIFFLNADSKIRYKFCFIIFWTNMMLLRFNSSLNIMNQSISIFLCLSAMFLLLFWPNDVAVDHFYNYIAEIFGLLSSSIQNTNENGNPRGCGNRWWHNRQYCRLRLLQRRQQPG